MLSRDQLQGMWVSVPTEWDEYGEFDEKTFRDEIALIITAGAHGVYTTGSTGEFYALDWEEYKIITDAFIAETLDKIPIQIGANWFNTRDTIRRVKYARDKGAGAAQICFPPWMSMRTENYDQFLIDWFNSRKVNELCRYAFSFQLVKCLKGLRDHKSCCKNGYISTLFQDISFTYLKIVALIEKYRKAHSR